MLTPTLAYPVVFSIENVMIVLNYCNGFIASLIASSRVKKAIRIIVFKQKNP
jgi:lipoprotein-releasing system permease protein